MVLFENVLGVLLLDDAQILDCLRSGSWRARIEDSPRQEVLVAAVRLAIDWGNSCQKVRAVFLALVGFHAGSKSSTPNR